MQKGFLAVLSRLLQYKTLGPEIGNPFRNICNSAVRMLDGFLESVILTYRHTALTRHSTLVRTIRKRENLMLLTSLENHVKSQRQTRETSFAMRN